MYRVWFTFRNDFGDVKTYLDNNGKGFDDDEAVCVSKELKAQGNKNVRVVLIGNQADREEMNGTAEF